MGKKVLVAYFSASGVTGKAARAVAAAAGADLYEIRPQAPYTGADLDWRDRQSRSSAEMADPGARPAMAGEMPDVARYDTVFVGFPIWWGVEPRVVDTFLDRADRSGKRKIPFATSGGSGIAEPEKRLKALYPAGSWMKGQLIRGGNAAGWVKSVLERA